jgi:hypothetical protein
LKETHLIPHVAVREPLIRENHRAEIVPVSNHATERLVRNRWRLISNWVVIGYLGMGG